MKAVCVVCSTEQPVSRKGFRVMPGQPVTHIIPHRTPAGELCSGRLGERVVLHSPGVSPRRVVPPV